MRWITQRTALSVGALAIVSFSTLAIGQSSSRNATQKANPAVLGAKEKVAPVPHRVELVIPKEPGWRGTIFDGFEDVDLPLRHALIDALTLQGVPVQRFAAFRELHRSDVRLDGWGVDLTAIDAARGVVTLKVAPLITVAGGGSATVLAAFEETYQFQGGLLNLLNTRFDGAPSAIIVD